MSAPSRSCEAGGYEPPATPAEEHVASVVAEVLEQKRVGRHDNFFDLGGDSLLATRVVSRLQTTGSLTLRQLFEHPTIAAMAGILDRHHPTPPLPPIRRVTRHGQLPLSFAQSRMWFLEQFSPGTAGHEVVVTVQLQGHLDVAALQSALDGLVARHEPLRTRFPSVDGAPRQEVLARAPIELRRSDLRTQPAPETSAFDLADALRAERFDLGRGPLLRALLARTADVHHVLVLVIHHIISDRWSMDVLGRELAVLYQAASTGTPPSLAPLEIDYVDYAAWQRDWLDAGVLEEQLAYWRAQLEGAEAVELHPDRPRPPVATHDGAEAELHLDAGVVAGLRALSRRLDVTLFVTLLAGFKALLARYCDTTDIVVGTPTSGRIRRELEGMTGFLVNTVVLRTDCSEDPTFEELIGRVRDTAWGALAHQDVPFDRLVEELGRPRDPSRHPLFQIMFSLQDPFHPADLPGLQSEWSLLPARHTPFDLTVLFMEAYDGSLTARLVFNPALFDRATIDRLAGHLGNLLASTVADPATPLSRLELLSPAERHQLLEEWNDTALAFTPACIHHLVESQVDDHPDALAVLAGDRSLTYAELDARANRLAHHLQAQGVGTGSCVALCLERSADMVVAVLATLKAGGAFVPLDATHPPARLAFILADTAAAVVLTHSRLQPLLPPTGAAVVVVDTAPAAGSGPRHRPASPASAADLAYVIYTSGSTGRPKGVMVEHRNVAHLAAAFAAAALAGAGDRVLAASPLSFDVAVLEVLVPLMTGGTCVVAPSLPHLDLWATVPHTGVNTVVATPCAWRLIGDPPHPIILERVMSGGEAMTPWLAAKLRKVAARVWNGYGPTETTVCSLACDVTDVIGVPPIGRPLANTRVYVVGPSGELVPVGVPGELWIGGAGVSRGYLGQEALTAERFLPDPFHRDGRVYRTGDVVRWRADGNLEFLGRRDDQVKIRGHRVECAEIEARLSAHPAVADAVVTARRDRSDEPELVAYVVPAGPAGGHGPLTAELTRHLRAALPPVMVPSIFVTLDRLPLSAHGKLDRAALPVPRPLRPDLDAAYEPPRTAAERRVAGLFAEVLHLDRVGIHDDFFELGGHSLLATRVVSRLGIDRSRALRALFATPTVAGLAAVLDGRPPGTRRAARHGRRPLGRVHVVPGAGGSTGWLVELLADVFSPGVDVVGLDYAFDSQAQARPPTLAEYLDGGAASISGGAGAVGGVFGYCAGAIAALHFGERLATPVFALDAPHPRAKTQGDTESAIRRRVRNLETAGNLPASLEGTSEDERLAWLGRNWSAPLSDDSLRRFRDDLRKFVFLRDQLAAESHWAPRRQFPLLMAMSKEFMEASPDALDHWQEAVPWATFEILDGGHLLAVRSPRCRSLLRRWAGLETAT